MKQLGLAVSLAWFAMPITAHACEEIGELPVPGVYGSVAQGLAFAADHYSEEYGDGRNYSIQLRIVIRVGLGVLALPVYKACNQTWAEADQTPTPPDVGGPAGDLPWTGVGTGTGGGVGVPGPWGGPWPVGGGGWSCTGTPNGVTCRPL